MTAALTTRRPCGGYFTSGWIRRRALDRRDHGHTPNPVQPTRPEAGGLSRREGLKRGDPDPRGRTGSDRRVAIAGAPAWWRRTCGPAASGPPRRWSPADLL